MTDRRWGILSARIILSTVLGLAAAFKLSDPADLASAIERYRLVTPMIAGMLALYLPWVEMFLALGLWIPRWKWCSAVLASGLLIVFTMVILLAWIRGLDIRCGCFGKYLGSTLVWAATRNLVLLFIGVLLVRSEETSGDVDH